MRSAKFGVRAVLVRLARKTRSELSVNLGLPKVLSGPTLPGTQVLSIRNLLTVGR